MDEPFYHCNFPSSEEYSRRQLRQTLEHGMEAGWSTTREGGTDRCPFTDPENDRYSEWEDTDRAIDALTMRRHGKITFFVGDGEYDFGFGMRPDWSEFGLPELGGVTLSWHRSQFEEDPATATRHVFDTATFVYEALRPAFAFSYLSLEVERETPVTQSDVEAGELPDAYWLMILPAEQCERIGRDRLESVPAWISEPVGEDSWGIVAATDPYRYIPKQKDSVREHLDLLPD